MRASLVVLTFLLCLPLGAVIHAGEPPIPIEGKLLVSGWDVTAGDAYYVYLMEGSSDTILSIPSFFDEGDVSPHADQVAYVVETGAWPNHTSDIWKADMDGSNTVDVTGPSGPGGINCNPQWSPDASMIAFQHCDPVVGLYPCEAGFQIWVVNANGSDPHRVTAESGTANEEMPRWSPNGYRVLFYAWDVGVFTIDIDGTDLEPVPVVAGEPDWSPDGSKIVSSATVADTVAGEPGVWRQLLLTNADGSNPQVLVEHFITYADVQAHVDLAGPWESSDPFGEVQWWVGPARPEWSPRGDRIAFVAAMPFDPDGPRVFAQDDLWVYDLGSGDVTKITSDARTEAWLSWNGHNTFPDDPEVTVDNTTVTFEEVTGDGLTTILRDDDPPELPTGYEFCEEFYEVTTTAQIAGPISICMTYDDADIPTGSSEADLCILHYVEDGDYWEDITVSRDPDNNVVCGETTSLSVFVLSGAPATRFPDVPSHGFGDSGIDPHWAFYEIEACAENGVVGGYGDGNYEPTWHVTRGQMAVFIARALVAPEGDEGLESWTAPATPTFPDVDTGFWAYKHVEYLKSLTIVAGYDDGLYHPTAIVTRDQMAAYISRAIADPKGDEGLAGFTPPATPTFPDVPEDQWAYTYIEYAAANDVVQGYPYPDPDDPDATIYRYLPNVILTRSQMAVYVARAFDLMP